jgi:hypothetical protein
MQVIIYRLLLVAFLDADVFRLFEDRNSLNFWTRPSEKQNKESAEDKKERVAAQIDKSREFATISFSTLRVEVSLLARVTLVSQSVTCSAHGFCQHGIAQNPL